MRNSSRSSSIKDRLRVPSKDEVREGAQKAQGVLRAIQKGLSLLILALSGASFGELAGAVGADDPQQEAASSDVAAGEAAPDVEEAGPEPVPLNPDGDKLDWDFPGIGGGGGPRPATADPLNSSRE